MGCLSRVFHGVADLRTGAYNLREQFWFFGVAPVPSPPGPGRAPVPVPEAPGQTRWGRHRSYPGGEGTGASPGKGSG